MKTFEYVTPTYVAPIDLNILNKTYSNLETMHQEAVKSSSELKSAIAQLNLHESEEPFRQQLVQNVEDTINANMEYGNLASAYDDIIKLSGDIVSNPGLIGRLKAQEEYTKFNMMLDSANLPDDYKEYYREKNPYSYTDRYDANGKLIQGESWKPIASPTAIVSLNDIVDKALERVADEQGQSVVTRWLDKNGNPTTDPSQAFDGEVYDVTTNTWQRLGADKIRDAIYAVIEETPGAKESLDQDYTIAKWKHLKNNTNPDLLTVSDITDENGNILTPSQYLAKRVNDSARTSSYNKSVSNTTYGGGLASYIKAKTTPVVGTGSYSEDTYNILDSAFRGEPITFTYNKGAKAYEMQNNLIHDITETLSRYGITVDINNYEDISDAIDLIPDTVNGESTSQIKAVLNYEYMLLEEARFNLDTIRESMSKTERERYDFALGMVNGGKAIQDRSRYDNRVITAENNLFRGGDNIVISFNNSTDLDNYLSMFPNSTNFEELGVSIEGNKIRISSENRNIIPMLSSKAQSYNKNNTELFGKVFGRQKSYDISVYDENGNEITNIAPATVAENIPLNLSKEEFIRLGNFYEMAQTFLDKYNDKYDISDKDLTISNLDIHGETFTDSYTTQMYNLGIMDMPEKKRIDDDTSKIIDNSLLNFDITQYDVYNSKGKITDAKTLQELKHEFRIALEDNRLSKTNSIVPGIIDANTGLQGGYTITIFPTTKEGKSASTNKTKQYYIPGLGQESYLQTLNQNPTFNASNTLDILDQTLSTKYLTIPRINPVIGNVTLKGVGNKNYVCNFNGHSFMLNKEDAVKLYTNLNDFNLIKRHIQSKEGSILEYLQSNERAVNALNQIVKVMSNITGYKDDLIEDILYNDLQN